MAGTATAKQRREYEAEQAAAEAAAAEPLPVSVLAPPAGMSAAAVKLWKQLAPHAMAAHTLTEATAHAFRNLCELSVSRDQVEKQIRREGRTVKAGKGEGAGRKKHPLMADLSAMRHAEATGLIRFKLHPIGREMDYVEPAPLPEADPFAEFDKQASSASSAADHTDEPAGERAH